MHHFSPCQVFSGFISCVLRTRLSSSIHLVFRPVTSSFILLHGQGGLGYFLLFFFGFPHLIWVSGRSSPAPKISKTSKGKNSPGILTCLLTSTSHLDPACLHGYHPIPMPLSSQVKLFHSFSVTLGHSSIPYGPLANSFSPPSTEHPLLFQLTVAFILSSSLCENKSNCIQCVESEFSVFLCRICFFFVVR